MKSHRRFAVPCHGTADDAGFALCLAAFAVSFAVLVGTADSGVVTGPLPGNEVAAAPVRQSLPGELAGVSVDGTRIYRIEGMTVSASRAVEMARMEREDRPARLAYSAGSAVYRPDSAHAGPANPAAGAGPWCGVIDARC